MKPPPPSNTSYIGRFAPSPSGPLHFGSLVTAVASYLHARQQQGQWQVRIDDLDPPRAVPGATEAILECLHQHGLHADGPVQYQSNNNADYESALQQLMAAEQAFQCPCSRRDLEKTQGRHQRPCRPAQPDLEKVWRFDSENWLITFDDHLQGRQSEALAGLSGDFVLKRRDGVFAYQLAVVVDDAALGVSDIVRGIDLMHATPRQIALQQALGLQSPRYYHLPVICHDDGEKLSKGSGAPAVQGDPCQNLRGVLRHLGLEPPLDLNTASQLLDWAQNAWRIDTLRHSEHIPLTV